MAKSVKGTQTEKNLLTSFAGVFITIEQPKLIRNIRV